MKLITMQTAYLICDLVDDWEYWWHLDDLSMAHSLRTEWVCPLAMNWQYKGEELKKISIFLSSPAVISGYSSYKRFYKRK